jgi:hypothetical protein
VGAGGGAAPAVGAAPAAGGAAAAEEAPKEEKAKEEEKEESDDDMVSLYAFTKQFLGLVANTCCVCRASVCSTNLLRSPAYQPPHRSSWYYCIIHCILHRLP